MHDARLDAVLAEHAEPGSGTRWVVDAESSPSDLGERLAAWGCGHSTLDNGISMARSVEPQP